MNSHAIHLAYLQSYSTLHRESTLASSTLINALDKERKAMKDKRESFLSSILVKIYDGASFTTERFLINHFLTSFMFVCFLLILVFTSDASVKRFSSIEHARKQALILRW